MVYGFSSYKPISLAEGGTPVTQIKVYKGDRKQVGAGVTKTLGFIAPRTQQLKIKTVINAPASVVAPISVGQQLATLDVMSGEKRLKQYPLLALSAVGEGSWWEQALDEVLLWFE